MSNISIRVLLIHAILSKAWNKITYKTSVWTLTYLKLQKVKNGGPKHVIIGDKLGSEICYGCDKRNIEKR